MAGGVSRQLEIPGGSPASQPGPRPVGGNVIGFPRRKPTGEPLQFPHKDPNGPWNKEKPDKPRRGPLANPNKFQESVADAKRKADAGWRKRHLGNLNSTYQRHTEAVISDQLRRELEPGLSWQPWKDRSRPLSRPLPKNPPLLTPAKIAKSGAKNGALLIGKKAITVVPIIGNVIGSAQIGGDISIGISELLGIDPYKPIGGSLEDWKKQPMPNITSEEEVIFEPPPEQRPDPFPSPGDFTDNSGQPFNGPFVKGEGLHRAFLKAYWAERDIRFYGEEELEGRSESYSRDLDMYVYGPSSNVIKITEVNEYPWAYGDPWNVTVSYWIVAYGYGFVGVNGEISDPRYYGSPTWINLLGITRLGGGVTVAAYENPSAIFYKYTWGDAAATIRWVTPTEYPDSPPLYPDSPTRNPQEEQMNCPNIKPILQAHQQQIIQLIQQGVSANISEANVTQISNNVSSNVSNAINQNVTNQINSQMQTLTTNVSNLLTNFQTSVQTSLNNFSTGVNTQLNTSLNTIGETVNSIKTSITQSTQEILDKIGKVSKWLQLDRILNVWTFILTVHNAAMVSNNLLQSVTQMVQNLATVMGNALGFRDIDDTPIDISKEVGATLDNILNAIFGAENVITAKREWAKLNTIFTAANNLMMALQGLNDAVLSAVSVVGERTANIGNALKKWGEVGETAYRWMNPNINFQNKFFAALERLENITQNIDSVTMNTLESQQIISELPKQIEELNKALGETDDAPTPKPAAPEAAKTASAADSAKAVSQSPDIAEADLQNDPEVG